MIANNWRPFTIYDTPPGGLLRRNISFIWNNIILNRLVIILPVNPKKESSVFLKRLSSLRFVSASFLYYTFPNSSRPRSSLRHRYYQQATNHFIHSDNPVLLEVKRVFMSRHWRTSNFRKQIDKHYSVSGRAGGLLSPIGQITNHRTMTKQTCKNVINPGMSKEGIQVVIPTHPEKKSDMPYLNMPSSHASQLVQHKCFDDPDQWTETCLTKEQAFIFIEIKNIPQCDLFHDIDLDISKNC